MQDNDKAAAWGMQEAANEDRHDEPKEKNRGRFVTLSFRGMWDPGEEHTPQEEVLSIRMRKHLYF